MNIAFQRRSETKKNGTHPIRLKLSTSNIDVQYISSGVSVFKNQWDNNKQVVKKHPLQENLNASLKSLYLKVEKMSYQNEGVSAHRLLFIYKNSLKYDSTSFLSFYQSVIEEMITKKKIRSAKTNQHYLDKLEKFASFVSFNDLTVQFALDYEKWMIKRGNKTNTIASNFKSIYAIINKAVKLGLIDINPMRGYTITTENVEKESLSYPEIEKMSDYNIPSQFMGKRLARDMFLFSFFSAGMRFTDVCKLRWDNIIGNDIVYTMNKSKSRAGARRTIPLNLRSIEILEKHKGNDDVFVFQPLYGYDNKTIEEVEYRIYIRNNSLNRSLKYLAKDLGINKNLSMHMSKHSFTDYAVKNDVGLLMISKLLGHAKLSTTQHYLKDFYHKEESDTINKLFS